MNLDEYKTYHFVGIGGMGMRALAEVLLEKGYQVNGSDIHDSPYLHLLAQKGAHIFIGQKAENIKDADVLIVSSAIPDSNPEVEEAHRLNIPVFHRSDVLAAIFQWGKGIAVAGAHGKSTVSAMIGKIFRDAGLDPTIVLGAAADYLDGGNSCLGHGDYVVAEADESDGSFLKFHTFADVVTNIEDDHLDHYGTVENIRKAFISFISHISYPDGAAFVCIDSEGVRKILPDVTKKYITFGTTPGADYQGINKRYVNKHLYFDVIHKGKKLGTLELEIPGTHNMRDALGAAACAMFCGIPFGTIRDSLRTFNGAHRRFQTKYRNHGLWIVDDYAHHPTEIKATLSAARECGNHRIICVFQPHRYSRTKLLKNEFVSAFKDADVIFFTDIFAAAEKPIPGIDGKLLPVLVKQKHPDKLVRYIPEFDDMAETLYHFIRPDDMVITMGAGNVYEVGQDLIHLLKEKGFSSDYKK